MFKKLLFFWMFLTTGVGSAWSSVVYDFESYANAQELNANESVSLSSSGETVVYNRVT